MNKILVTEKEYKFLKSIITIYKSSPYLNEKQKENLINKTLKFYEERYIKSLNLEV